MSELDDNIAASERVTAYLRSLQQPGVPVTDNTAQVQAAIDAGTVLAPGTYVCSGLTYPSHCRLHWPGVTLKAHSSLPPDRSLLWNKNFNADSDCLISGITFDGSGLARSEALVYAIGVEDFLFTDCAVINTGYIGLGLANGNNNRVIRCYFARTGKLEETVEGGPAIWVGATGGHKTTNTEIIDCLCEDTQWSFIYLAGSSTTEMIENVTVAGNVTRRTMESAMFVSNLCSGVIIRNNTIDTTTRKHISASGIELGASGTVMEGNVILNTGNGCIDMMDVSNATIRHNVLGNPGMEPSYFTRAAGVQVVTMPGSAPVGNVTIERNWMFADSPTHAIAVGFDRQESAPQVHDVKVTLNNAAGSAWSPSALYVAPGMLGPNCVIEFNTGF